LLLSEVPAPSVITVDVGDVELKALEDPAAAVDCSNIELALPRET
jgi:hypothetical protein